LLTLRKQVCSPRYGEQARATAVVTCSTRPESCPLSFLGVFDETWRLRRFPDVFAPETWRLRETPQIRNPQSAIDFILFHHPAQNWQHPPTKKPIAFEAVT
jgi:hypothetical protein